MAMVTGRLILIKDDRFVLDEFRGTMDKHEALATGLRIPVIDDECRCLITLHGGQHKQTLFHPLPQWVEQF